MERRELNRMFDRLAPSPEQEQAVLDRLLQTERKGTPVKKLKKLTVLGIAAALMVISCAAAVVTGLDQRLADYFGATPEQAELLLPGAVPVDITVENNGAVFHVSQVLMDRYSFTVLADFTAPEGTVLDERERLHFDLYTKALDQDGNLVNPHRNWSSRQKLLDDGDPLDNHLTVLYQMLTFPGFQPDDEIQNLYLTVKHLVSYDGSQDAGVPVYLGDWSCQIPMVWQDIGQSVQPNQTVGELDGIDITLTEFYLSPMTLRLQLKSEIPIPREFGGGIGNRWSQLVNFENVTLTTRSGKTIPLTDLGGSSGDQDKDWMFRLDEITALEDLEGGTLNIRIEGGSVDVPLEGLIPVE